MEIGKAIRFITEDPRWQQKLLIGTGIFVASMVLSVVLIGILGLFIITGYVIRLLQNVRDGHPYPLPEWDQLGDDLARGFKLAVVTVVWALPLMLLSIPSAIGGAMAGSNSEAAQVMGVMLSIIGSCLSVVGGLALTVLLPGISIAFARDEQIMSGLQLRPIWDWTVANIGQVIVVSLVYLAASFVIGIVSVIGGVLLCVIGLIVTIPLGSLVATLFQYHLYGQLAYAYPMDGVQRITPPPVAPPAEPTPERDVPPTTEASSDTPSGEYSPKDVDNPPSAN